MTHINKGNIFSLLFSSLFSSSRLFFFACFFFFFPSILYNPLASLFSSLFFSRFSSFLYFSLILPGNSTREMEYKKKEKEWCHFPKSGNSVSRFSIFNFYYCFSFTICTCVAASFVSLRRFDRHVAGASESGKAGTSSTICVLLWVSWSFFSCSVAVVCA